MSFLRYYLQRIGCFVVIALVAIVVSALVKLIAGWMGTDDAAAHRMAMNARDWALKGAFGLALLLGLLWYVLVFLIGRRKAVPPPLGESAAYREQMEIEAYLENSGGKTENPIEMAIIRIKRREEGSQEALQRALASEMVHAVFASEESGEPPLSVRVSDGQNVCPVFTRPEHADGLFSQWTGHLLSPRYLLEILKSLPAGHGLILNPKTPAISLVIQPAEVASLVKLLAGESRFSP